MKLQTKLFLAICLWTVILVSCADAKKHKKSKGGKGHHSAESKRSKSKDWKIQPDPRQERLYNEKAAKSKSKSKLNTDWRKDPNKVLNPANSNLQPVVDPSRAQRLAQPVVDPSKAQRLAQQVPANTQVAKEAKKGKKPKHGSKSKRTEPEKSKSKDLESVHSREDKTHAPGWVKTSDSRSKAKSHSKHKSKSKSKGKSKSKKKGSKKSKISKYGKELQSEESKRPKSKELENADSRDVPRWLKTSESRSKAKSHSKHKSKSKSKRKSKSMKKGSKKSKKSKHGKELQSEESKRPKSKDLESADSREDRTHVPGWVKTSESRSKAKSHSKHKSKSKSKRKSKSKKKDSKKSKKSKSGKKHQSEESKESMSKEDEMVCSDSRTIQCESQRHFEKCDVKVFGTGKVTRVTLEKERSRRKCEEGKNWGFDRNSIWVNSGCKAEFKVCVEGASETSCKHTRIIPCKGRGRRFEKCELKQHAPGAEIVWAEVDRQLSRLKCKRDESWGHDMNSLWVNNGCQANFKVCFKGAINKPCLNPKTIRCESSGFKAAKCEVKMPEDQSISDASIQRQLSRTKCILEQNWGYDRNVIWVNGGCRADFEVCVGDEVQCIQYPCQSKGGKRTCRLHLPPERVKVISMNLLEDQSGTGGACIEDQTYGAVPDEFKMWSNKKCKAVFDVCLQIIVEGQEEREEKCKDVQCGSRRNKKKHCRVRHAHQIRSVTINQLFTSNTEACELGKTFGSEKGESIWVSGDCSAEFKVCYLLETENEIKKRKKEREDEWKKRGGSGQECSDCDENASCNDNRGRCECNPGFTGDGKTCKVGGCICEAHGDPHYKPFDSSGKGRDLLHFQGPCKYNLVTLESPTKENCNFKIDVKNEYRDSFSVTVLRYADIYFNNDKIRLGPKEAVTINGVSSTPPSETSSYRLVVSGRYYKFFMKECANEITFDRNNRLHVTVAREFGPYLSGICGNCNNDMGDDCVDSDGVAIPLVNGKCPTVEFGESHEVYDEENDMEICSVTDVPDACVDEYKDKAASMDYCGMLNLTNQNSPFHQAILNAGLLEDEFVQETAESYFDSCEYDVCNKFANLQDGTDTACSTIEQFLTALADEHEAVVVDYRRPGFCMPECGPNEEFYTGQRPCEDVCGETADTCGLMTDEPACSCKTGFARSGTDCVRKEDCGCSMSDEKGISHYYKLYERMVNENCTTEYTCLPVDGMAVMEPSPHASCLEGEALCAPGDDGIRTCKCVQGKVGDGANSCFDGCGSRVDKCHDLAKCVQMKVKKERKKGKDKKGKNDDKKGKKGQDKDEEKGNKDNKKGKENKTGQDEDETQSNKDNKTGKKNKTGQDEDGETKRKSRRRRSASSDDRSSTNEETDSFCKCNDGYDGDGIKTCHSTCTCSHTGDPHTELFDGQECHFQGPCTYLLSRINANENCSMTVKAKHLRPEGKTASTTQTVYVEVGDNKITLDQNGINYVNGLEELGEIGREQGLPFKLTRSGKASIVDIPCGASVSFDGRRNLFIKIPSQYGNEAEGYCGNCDNKKNDLVDDEGNDISKHPNKDSIFGQRWLVPNEDDDDKNCDVTMDTPVQCTDELQKKAEEACGRIFTESDFAECLQAHPQRGQEAYEECVFDYCLTADVPAEQEENVCSAFSKVHNLCAPNFEVTGSWRTASFCPASEICHESLNEVYNPQMVGCQPSCLDPTLKKGCRDTTVFEGCQCKDGYLLENNQCIPKEECGCILRRGRKMEYFSIGTNRLEKGCRKEYSCSLEGGEPTFRTTMTGGCDRKTQRCRKENGHYQCVCRRGYKMIDGKCVNFCDGQTCDTNARCTRRNGCRCKRGFTGNGVECEPGTDRCRCRASGDAHYFFYDYHLDRKSKVDFQGICKYKMTKYVDPAGMCSVTVEVQNERRTKPYPSYTRYAEITLNDGTVITLGQGGELKVNGQVSNTADEPGVYWVIKSGTKLTLETQCKQVFTFDGDAKLEVDMPKPDSPDDYEGLCGNCNGIVDEFVFDTGEDISNLDKKERDKAYGNRWLVGDDLGLDPEACVREVEDKVEPDVDPAVEEEAKSLCNDMKDPNGNFGDCAQALTDADAVDELYEMCVDDLKLGAVSEKEKEKTLKESYQIYMQECAEITDAELPDLTSPPFGEDCGDNEEYYVEPGMCEKTCRNAPCIIEEVAGCYCKSGFVRNDVGDCIRTEECGCPFEMVDESGQTSVIRVKTDERKVMPDCTVRECRNQVMTPIQDTQQCNSVTSECVNTPNGYQCVCREGYSGPDGYSCTPEPEPTETPGRGPQTEGSQQPGGSQPTKGPQQPSQQPGGSQPSRGPQQPGGSQPSRGPQQPSQQPGGSQPTRGPQQPSKQPGGSQPSRGPQQPGGSQPSRGPQQPSQQPGGSQPTSGPQQPPQQPDDSQPTSGPQQTPQQPGGSQPTSGSQQPPQQPDDSQPPSGPQQPPQQPEDSQPTSGPQPPQQPEDSQPTSGQQPPQQTGGQSPTSGPPDEPQAPSKDDNEDISEPCQEEDKTTPAPLLKPKPPGDKHPECISNADDDGRDYWGTMDVTITHLPCQRWDSQTPHRHNYHHLSEEKNFCRNRPRPGHLPKGRPWCFTTDPDTPIQYCKIPKCKTPDEEAGITIPEEVEEEKRKPPDDEGCYNITDFGRHYEGPKAVSHDGEICNEWKKYDYAFEDNFCRNPESDGEEQEPWCFCRASKVKCVCGVPPCNVEKDEIEKIPTACKVKSTFSACMTETTMTGSCETTTELPNGCTISVAQQNKDAYEVLVTPPGQESATRILKRHNGNMFESESCGTVILEKSDEIKIKTPTCGMCLEFYVKSFLPPPAQPGKPAQPGICPAN